MRTHCVICNNPIPLPNRKRVTCNTPECKRVNKNNHTKAWRKTLKDNALPEEPKAMRPCLRCGTPFMTDIGHRICPDCRDANRRVLETHSEVAACGGYGIL